MFFGLNRSRFVTKSVLSSILPPPTPGLALQTASLSSDSWTELRLTSVARCSTKDPVFYEAGCRKLRWTDHQVARAGLWNVCYSFPKGIVPQMYFPTKPYCADFDDDVFPGKTFTFPMISCSYSLRSLNNIHMKIVSSHFQNV